jgi:hypothetical protein
VKTPALSAERCSRRRNAFGSLSSPAVAQAGGAALPALEGWLADLSVEPAVVLEVHPGEECLVELVEGADPGSANLGEESALHEPIERLDRATAASTASSY